mmetsp:Transcript_1820/g.3195  ORF Transcript_1820/g.3195 Transcript_1820/m.3195 type:complete len:164 (-) Transcript_1820:803-1294(-)
MLNRLVQRGHQSSVDASFDEQLSDLNQLLGGDGQIKTYAPESKRRSREDDPRYDIDPELDDDEEEDEFAGLTNEELAGKGNPEDFSFDDFSKEHHLNDLEDFGAYAKENHLKIRSLGVVVQIEIFNNGSHFSEDKFNLALMYCLLLLIFAALAVANYRRYVED